MKFSDIHFFTVPLCDVMINLAIVNLFISSPLSILCKHEDLVVKMYFAKIFHCHCKIYDNHNFFSFYYAFSNILPYVYDLALEIKG